MIKPLMIGFAILILITIISLVFHDWNILLKYSGVMGLVAFVLSAIFSGSFVNAERKRLNNMVESKQETEMKWKWSKIMLMISVPNIIGALIVLFSIPIHSVTQTSSKSSESENPVNYNYTFKGQSEHWSAVLEENITYESIESGRNNEKSKFTLTYKGSDIKSVGKVNWSYDTVGGMTGKDYSLQSDGTIVSEGSGINVAVPS